MAAWTTVAGSSTIIECAACVERVGCRGALVQSPMPWQEEHFISGPLPRLRCCFPSDCVAAVSSVAPRRVPVKPRRRTGKTS